MLETKNLIKKSGRVGFSVKSTCYKLRHKKNNKSRSVVIPQLGCHKVREDKPATVLRKMDIASKNQVCV